MAESRASEFNGGDDEEEALRIAIAMSLGQDPANSAGEASVVDLTGDDQPAEGNFPALVSRGVRPKAPESTEPATPAASTSSSTPLLGLDRKQMEEERLARLKKRKLGELEDAEGDGIRQRQKTIEKVGSTSAMPPNSPGMPKLSRGGQAASERPAHEDTRKISAAVPFPAGVVKKTWALGQPRLGDDIKIEEVLQKNHLELAVLSSFQWDDTWLMSKVDLRRTKMILVAFASDEAQREEMRSNVPRDKIRFCFPRMHGPGAMHSKLQLLKYSDYLRIVVPTGNLVPYDWGESGSMENMVFLIDLPKIQDPGPNVAIDNRLTAFGEDLCYFLSAQGLDDKLVASLGNYNWSETSRYAFVHSIAGSHQTDVAWRRTGYCGLGRAVHALGLGSDSLVQIDFVCSSVGSVNEGLVTALYNACQGDSGLREYQHRTANPKAKGIASKADNNNWEKIRDRFRVYFPSHATVAQSKGGVHGAGTICFQSKWWKAPTFPHCILRDCKSVRPGLLMHSKVLFVQRPYGDHGSGRAFAYVGSANFSESAWGRLSQDRVTKKPKLNCRNWECGVLVQAGSETAMGFTPALVSPGSVQTGCDKSLGGGAGNLVATFEGYVPVPMQVPGASFPAPSQTAAGSSTAPWFFISAAR